jgi:hypothetical protein
MLAEICLKGSGLLLTCIPVVRHAVACPCPLIVLHVNQEVADTEGSRASCSLFVLNYLFHSRLTAVLYVLVVLQLAAVSAALT